MPQWPETHIFPVVVGHPGAPNLPWDIRAVVGTAFAFGDTVMTCWHAVRDAIGKGLQVAINIEDEAGTQRVVPVAFEQSQSGHDLAYGRMPWSPEPRLRLVQSIHEGMNVYTYGFPLPGVGRSDDDSIKFKVWLRLFKGYIVSSTMIEFPGFVEARACELDILAPSGISGAPVLLDKPGQGGTRELVGVVQGVFRVETDGEHQVTLARAYQSEIVAEILAEAGHM